MSDFKLRQYQTDTLALGQSLLVLQARDDGEVDAAFATIAER